MGCLNINMHYPRGDEHRRKLMFQGLFILARLHVRPAYFREIRQQGPLVEQAVANKTGWCLVCLLCSL